MISIHNILIAADDKIVSDLLKTQLSLLEEFKPVTANSAVEIFRFINSCQFNAIVVGNKLQDTNNTDLYRRIRQMKILIPFIFLIDEITHHVSDYNNNDEFSSYILRPFRVTSLIKTLRASLQKFENSADGILRIGPFVFKPADRLLINVEHHNKISLTDKETLILKFLYNAVGKAVNRNTLLEQVWGYNAGITTHTLETHIYRLRQKIENSSGVSKILITDTNGYRLVLEI